VRVVTTKPAQSFFSEQELGVRVYQNEDEWEKRWQRGDAVLHIELRRWADIMVIAPLSANTLAKISNGLCDNLLSTVVRCWSFSSNPLLLAPAMNTLMWDSPFTSKQLGALQEMGATTIPPVAKKLACGDEGMGAMASVEEIEQAAQQAWKGMMAAGYQQQPVPASMAQ
jgi:phosphopantothenoylcysteine decarboxylase